MQKKAKAAVEPVRQRTQFSCVAASLTMALKALGVVCTQDEVAQVMGVAPMKGATWEDCIAAAQHYGCQATLVCPSTVGEIQRWTDEGDPVIIAWNPEGREWSHASLVFDVVDDMLHIADPNIPDPDETVRVVHKSEFYKKWVEKWPRYLVRRPAMRIRREISPEGRQLLAMDNFHRHLLSFKGPGNPTVDSRDHHIVWFLDGGYVSMTYDLDGMSEVTGFAGEGPKSQRIFNEKITIEDWASPAHDKVVQSAIHKAVQAVSMTRQASGKREFKKTLALLNGPGTPEIYNDQWEIAAQWMLQNWEESGYVGLSVEKVNSDDWATVRSYITDGTGGSKRYYFADEISLTGIPRADAHTLQRHVDMALRKIPSKYRTASDSGVSIEEYDAVLSGEKMAAVSLDEMDTLLHTASMRNVYKNFRPRTYLYNFFREKDIPSRMFDIVDSEGMEHSIPNEAVIEYIASTSGRERQQIEDTLRKIDFHNGDVNHFLQYVAKFMADSYSGAMRFARFEEGEDVTDEEMRKYLGQEDYAKWVKNKELHRDKFKAAKFEKGKEMSAEEVAKYLRDHGAPEAADKWLAEHSKNKDKFKKAGRSAIDIVKRLDFYGYMSDVWEDRRMGDEMWRMVEHGEERIVREMLEEADQRGLLDNLWRNLDDKITSGRLKDDALALAKMIGTRRMDSPSLGRWASKRVRLTDRLASVQEPSAKEASSVLTSDLLMRAFRNLDQRSARDIVAAFKDDKKQATDVLRIASEALDAYGVESLMDQDMNTVAWYVNAGDAEKQTLFYDARSNDYYLAKWGAWVDAFEKTGSKIKIASDWDGVAKDLEWM